jgi:hypothetical protein
VWEWRLETGVYSRDISTQKLKKLELGDLSIAETAAHKRPPHLGGAKPMPGGGFNPYDNSGQTGAASIRTPARSRSARRFSRLKPTERPARKPADLKKLEEWMKLKKRVQDAKDRDDD